MSQQKKQNVKHETKPIEKAGVAKKNNFKSVIANDVFPLTALNFKLAGIGGAIILIGFILMALPGDAYGFRKMNLSTFLVMFGFAFEIYAIMKRKKAA